LGFFLGLPLAAGAKGPVPPYNSTTLAHINIAGNTITRESIILRALPIQEGQRMSKDSIDYYLAQSKLRLANLGLFTTISITNDPTSADSTDWHITLRERWYVYPKPIFQLADRNFNVWWRDMHQDLRRINLGLTLTNKNFRGNGENLSATVQAGYTQRLAVDYIRPFIDKRQQHGIGFSLSVSQSGEIAYATDSNKLRFARLPGSHILRVYEGGVTWTYRPRYAVRHSLTLGYHDINISDTVRNLNSDYFSNGAAHLRYADLVYRLDINHVDNWNYPLKGFKSVNYIVLRKGFNDLGYGAQWRTETGIFHNPSPGWYTSAIFRGRLCFPNDVPYYFQSALGTRTDYIRGYEYYVVDGTHYGVLRLDLKRELLNKTVLRLPFKYLPEFPLRIYPKVFFDAGAVHNPNPGNSFLHDRLLYAGGVGIDIVTAYDIKVRLELALNALGQYGLYLHLNSE
jgi:hypothetical protein